MKSWVGAIILRYRLQLVLLIGLQLACGLLIALQPRYYQQLVSLAMDGPSPALYP